MDDKDERLPVLLGHAVARDGDLRLAMPPAARHTAACSCCGGRDPLAVALARAFMERARGELAWFDRVVIEPTDRQDIERLAAVLADDPVTRARFRQANAFSQ